MTIPTIHLNRFKLTNAAIEFCRLFEAGFYPEVADGMFV